MRVFRDWWGSCSAKPNAQEVPVKGFNPQERRWTSRVVLLKDSTLQPWSSVFSSISSNLPRRLLICTSFINLKLFFYVTPLLHPSLLPLYRKLSKASMHLSFSHFLLLCIPSASPPSPQKRGKHRSKSKAGPQSITHFADWDFDVKLAWEMTQPHWHHTRYEVYK